MFRRLALPVYIDEDKNRTARALQGVLQVLLVVLLVITPVLFAIKNLSALMGSFYLLGGIVITWALLKLRRLELASLFFIASSVLLLTYFMLIGQGVHDITIIALPMLLVMAGLTLKRKAYLILAGATVIAVNFVVFAEIHGWFHSGAQSQTTYADLLVVSAILIATIVIVRMLADYLYSSLDAIRQGVQRQRGLYLETRAQAEQLRILNQTSSAIAAGLDLDRMLEELYVQLKRVLPLDSFYVALIDEKVGVITFPIFYSSGVRVEIPAESLDAGSGLTGEVIRSRKTIYLPDVFDQGAQEEHEIISIGPGETRSYVGLPLHMHGEVFGALSIQSQQPHAYFNDQLRLLETITAQASVAIDNARLFVEATATLRRDERLSEVARVISSTLDLQFILENVVRLAAELLEADTGILNLIAAGNQDLSHVYHYGLPAQVDLKPRPRGAGFTWWMIDHREPVAVRDIAHDPRINPVLQEAGFHALAAAPILAGDECLGVMSVLCANPLRVFIERDVAALEALGRLAGSAIRNARLYAALQQELNERQRVENALHQRDAILEAITFAAETFLKAPDWRQVIDPVLKRLSDDIGATRAHICEAQRGPNGRLLFTLRYEYLGAGGASSMDNPALNQAPAESMGTKRWLYAMLRGEPYYGSITTLPPEDIEFLQRIKTLSILNLPVVVGNEFWGVIGFENSLEERLWSEAEVDSLKVAASVLGAAILRQHSDDAVRTLNLELEQRVAERTTELQLANQELESFAYSVSHDLRTPLRGIDGYSRLLLEDYCTELDEQGKTYLGNVRRATSHMSELIDDLLKLSRITRAEMHRQVVDLSVLAEQVTADFRRSEPEREVEISIQPDLYVYGDANLLQLALENLVNNAWKFTRRSPQPRIEIGATHQKGRPIYFVRDNGVGFDMKFKDKLFMAFQRLHSPDDFEGTGIGLATVQRVIQRHSGHIWAEGEVDRGATFFFTLFDPDSA